MRVKMSEIAKQLGISKAAVSLAVNGKPGVSVETRRKILDCIQEMEQKAAPAPDKGRIILVYFGHMNKHMLNKSFPIYMDVFDAFAYEITSRGYRFTTAYVNLSGGTPEAALSECMQKDVAGVVLFATSMEPDEYKPFSSLPVPVVLYDQEAPDFAHSSVCIDHETALRMALMELCPSKRERVLYLAVDQEIYNQQQRRKFFVSEMRALGRDAGPENFLNVGFYPEQSEKELFDYYMNHPVPECIIAENYSAAVGLLMALNRLDVRYPERVRIASIDTLPLYVPGGNRIIQISLPHAERVPILLDVLEREIRDKDALHQRVLALPKVYRQTGEKDGRTQLQAVQSLIS